MVSPSSLFACAASDVTLDRVKELLAQGPPESLTLEYKQQKPTDIARAVAAMANSYGGIVLVGVRDDRIIVGVPETEIVSIVNSCHDVLEPPWQPEVVPVPVGDGTGSYLVVLRIDAARAPRPLLVRGAAPIRLEGRTATADRQRLRQLFSEPLAANIPSYEMRLVHMPQLLQQADGTYPFDLALRTGTALPLTVEATWRPLSETSRSLLKERLGASSIALEASRWMFAFQGSRTPFHLEGLPNTARAVRLVSQVSDVYARTVLEVVAAAHLPGPLHAGPLTFTLDVSARLPEVNSAPGRISVLDMLLLIDAMVATLTRDGVAEALASIAGIERELVPQPSNVEFVASRPVEKLLEHGFSAIKDAGMSMGASLLVDPTKDLRETSERAAQVGDWLAQIALDAGLEGMEAKIANAHVQLEHLRAQEGNRPG